MGRLAAALNTSERLRPWADAGISHLLLGERAREIRAAKTAGARSKPAAAGPAPGPKPGTAPSPGPPPSATHKPPPPGAGQTAQPQESPPSGREPGQLPPAWEERLAAIPAGAKILFTYFELGQDMGGAPDSLRRELLTTIIHLMRWPKGVLGFWPHTEYSGQDILPRNDLFWRGVSRLGVKRVAVFGERSLSELLPEADPKRLIQRRGDVHLLRLPSTQDLKQSTFEQIMHAIDPLRSFLHGLD